MNLFLNYGMIALPAGFLLLQASSSSSSSDQYGMLREIGTFLVSALLAWAVRYIRQSRAEVKSAKETLPSKGEVKGIKDDYTALRADVLLLTDTLERTRQERDTAQTLLADATAALTKSNGLLEEERKTNADWGRLSRDNDEKIAALEQKVGLLSDFDKLVDRFTDRVIEVMVKNGTLPEESSNVT